MDQQTKQWIADRIVWTVALVTAVFVATSSFAAERHVVAINDTWTAECGSCHVPYPPRLLPATSWRAIMAGLDRHFGVDASVDANAASVIGAFLQENAGRARPEGIPTLRITDTAWFRHEHDEIAAAVWRNPKVKSAANCAACHRGAQAGVFDERSVHIPR
jgi:nitrate/TMAO reductase-like tetraheme cytochrome c subunit